MRISRLILSGAAIGAIIGTGGPTSPLRWR
jgi:hypothetical protein